MKKLIWTLFLPALLISALFFPANIIGCGGSVNPYDYFTTFIARSVVPSPVARQFYYTAMLDFYDDWNYTDSVSQYNAELISEWQQQAKSVNSADVRQVLYKMPAQQLQNALKQWGLPAYSSSAKGNTFLLQAGQLRKKEWLEYLLMAKQTESFCTTPDVWSEAPPRDSMGINNWIAKAQLARQASTDVFMQAKYAYLQVKLAFYNHRFEDCAKWYEQYLEGQPQWVVSNLALGYVAGAAFKQGRGKQAAFQYSQAFAKAGADQRKRIFMGFLWSTDGCNAALMDEYVAMGKTAAEKAQVAALFGLYGTQYHLPVIEKVWTLDASCPILPLLVVRELNKMEEGYLSPKLTKQPGSNSLGLDWYEEDSSKLTGQHVDSAARLFEKLAQDERVISRPLMAAAAAYVHYMANDAAASEQWAARAAAMRPDTAVMNQVRMIQLLNAAAVPAALAPEKTKTLMPAIAWLEQQANTSRDYALLKRNFFSQVVAPYYYQRGDRARAVLAHAVANHINPKFGSYDEYQGVYGGNNGEEMLRNELSRVAVQALHTLMTDNKAKDLDAYMIANGSVTKDEVADMMATAYLREFDFANAIVWLKKQRKPTLLMADLYDWKTDRSSRININPLHDYINDWQRFEKPVTKPYSKLSFAQKMLSLQQALDTARTNAVKARLCYQLASGFYNMSYYGNAWEMVAYYRPSSDWNNELHQQQEWQREYYGVHKAGEYYQKAYALASDREFKAAAFFLFAKCKQRQLLRPQYDWKNSDNYYSNEQVFLKQFRQNTLFPQFHREFGNTKFYQYAASRCSYLRDFAKKR